MQQEKVGNLLMYWLRVPFSSSTGAAKAQVMKNAMMPECNQDEVDRQNWINKPTNTAMYIVQDVFSVHLRAACQQGVSRSQRETLLNAPDLVIL